MSKIKIVQNFLQIYVYMLSHWACGNIAYDVDKQISKKH